MEKYNPKAIEALRYMVNAMTGLSLTENDVFRELEAMQERYGPGGDGSIMADVDALASLHTMRPADPAFTRTYLGDAS